MPKLSTIFLWIFLGSMLLFLYAPLIPPIINSFATDKEASIFANYQAILDDARLLRSIGTSISASLLTAIIAPLLALVAAEAVRVWQIPRLVIGIITIPLFVPGVSMGVATALFFKLLGIPPSLLTITAVQVLWALPFAFLIILTTMANFNPIYLEAAYLSGANRLQAFFEVELPQIHPGLLGASIFSFILAFNETIRTAVVQGGQNTVQTYLWAQYQQIGLAPNLFALMTVMIVTTLCLLALLALLDRHRYEQST